MDTTRRALIVGAVAGLAGGLALGVGLSLLGMPPTLAVLIGSGSNPAGLVAHSLFSALLGAIFGAFIRDQRLVRGETLFWGVTYGALWWFLAPLTLIPLARGTGLAWTVAGAQAAFPDLLGFLWYGGVTGLVFVALSAIRGEAGETQRATPGVLLGGALAGLLSGSLLGLMLDAQGQLLPLGSMMMAGSRPAAWLMIALIGLLAGTGFALLYPLPHGGAGVTLVRGTVYGFVWWVGGALTLMPLAAGLDLPWTLPAVQSGFATLPGYLLFGAAVALTYQGIGGLVRLLFSDSTGDYGDEGAGVRGLRAIGRGAVAGLVGGLLFTLVMVQIGFLPTVARLVGSTVPLTGLIVHLVIAFLIGTSYGLLFRGQTYDVSSALGWGVSYGFFWWILGALTLLPVFLGAAPQWSVAGAAEAFPALIGHLAYGAGLGLTFHWLEARHSPWWVARTEIEARRAQLHRDQLRTAAPALWLLVVVIALTVPILLGM